METISFDYDAAAPLDVQETGRQTRDGALIRDISFAGPGGERVTASLVAPVDGPKPPHAAILWVHWYEPESRDSNRTEFLDEAVMLAGEGAVSLLPDAFWSTTPAAFAANPHYVWKTDYPHDRDLCIRQTNELRRALDLLLEQPGIDRERVGFVGHDFGAMYGALVAGLEHRAQVYVLMAGTYSFSDWFIFGSKLSEEGNKAYIEQMKVFDPTRYIKEAAPARLFFQFAHADVYVPERAAQVFYEAASDPKEIAWYEAQHDLKDIHNASGQERLNWLRQQLKLGPEQPVVRNGQNANPGESEGGASKASE